MASRLVQVSADGAAYAGPCWLKSAILSAGIDAATVVVKDGGAAGTTLATLKALTATSVVWASGDSDGVYLATDCYLDVTGTGVLATIEVEPVD